MKLEYSFCIATGVLLICILSCAAPAPEPIPPPSLEGDVEMYLTEVQDKLIELEDRIIHLEVELSPPSSTDIPIIELPEGVQ